MDQVRSIVGQLGRQRLIVMALVAAALLATMGAVALRGGNAAMGYLYTDLDPATAQGMAEKLKAQNVAFQLSADGTAIMAPEDKLGELRMSMAGEKLGGKIGYDVLDQEEPFGVSATRAKMNETRAIEGELARSIGTLQSVSSARVHLVMPERAMFATEAAKASAAVTVKTKGRLSAEQVQSIRYLVSSSVASLSPESVSIVDQTGALLARAGDPGTTGGAGADERQRQVEGTLRDEIEALLAPIVGQGKVRAEVSADIDRDQTQEESDVYDPDKQVIGHQISVSTKDQNADTQAGAQGASVARQLPDAQGAPGSTAAGPNRTEAHDETSEDTTYDNSRTHSTVLRGPGRIKRLTVAVMVDAGPAGLPAAQVQRLTHLVENAVGVDAQRGDSVVIEGMPFAKDTGPSDDAPGWMSRIPVDPLIGFGKLLLIAGVGLFALRMIRPRPAADPGSPGGAQLLTAQGHAADAADAPALSVDDALPTLPAPSVGGGIGLDEEIALAQVDGHVKVSALKRVGDAVAGSPPEAAAVIRQWMNA